MKNIIALIIVLLLGFILLIVVDDMPITGYENVPTNNMMKNDYITKSTEEVKSLNIITAILVDFRGYDTLIETIVLFTASISVLAVLKSDN